MFLSETRSSEINKIFESIELEEDEETAPSIMEENKSRVSSVCGDFKTF